MELAQARATCKYSDLHEFGSSDACAWEKLERRLQLPCADRVCNTTAITLALVPEDYEVKLGRTRRHFTAQTLGMDGMDGLKSTAGSWTKS
jgi:hypothetical protein